MIKILIKKVVDSTIGKLLDGTGALGSEYKDRAFWQHYGFTSIPREGAQGIVIKQGNNHTCIASEPTEGEKPTLDVEGDVAIYTASNMFVKINADGEIQIKGNGNENSIRLGTETLKKLLTEEVLQTLEVATMPVSGAVAGPYAPGTFTAPLPPVVHTTKETAAS